MQILSDKMTVLTFSVITRLFSAALLKPKVDFHCRVILILTRMNKIRAMYGRSRVNVKVRAAFFTWPLFYLRTYKLKLRHSGNSHLHYLKSLKTLWYSISLTPFLTRGYARAYHELLQGQGYANESLAHS